MKLFVVVDENKQARGMLVYNKNKDKLTEDTSYTYAELAEKHLGNKKLPIRNMLRLFSMNYCVGVSVVEKNTFIQLCKNDKLTVFIEYKDKNPKWDTTLCFYTWDSDSLLRLLALVDEI